MTTLLEKLNDIEKLLPDFLKVEEDWCGERVVAGPHKADRVFREYNNIDVYLHRLYPCKPEDAIMHTHEGPTAIRILFGNYIMRLGHFDGASYQISSTMIAVPGFSYEMMERRSSHSVAPLTEVYSVRLLDRNSFEDHKEIEGGVSVNSLEEDDLREMLARFKTFYPKTDVLD